MSDFALSGSVGNIQICEVWSCDQPASFYKYPVYSLRSERQLRCARHADGTFKRMSQRLWPQDGP